MKVLVVLSALVAFAAAVALTTTELEVLQAFPFDTMLANDEQRDIFLNCLLEKCESDAYKELAELSLRAVVNQCAECSPAQNTKYDTVMKLLQDKYEYFYKALMKKVAAKKDATITLF